MLTNGGPMPTTSAERIEAGAIRAQMQMALRLLESRIPSQISQLLGLIKEETRQEVTLSAEYAFTNEEPLREQDPSFAEYTGRLETALYHSVNVAEYSNWQYRYGQFQAQRPDFKMRALIVRVPEHATFQQPVVWLVKVEKRVFEITANDRRFLRSLRIAADEPSF